MPCALHVLNVVDTSPARIPPPLDMALLAADAVAGEILHKRQVKELSRARGVGRRSRHYPAYATDTFSPRRSARAGPATSGKETPDHRLPRRARRTNPGSVRR